MTRALIIIDIQRDYFAGGALPLVEPDAAATAAHAVLESFRASGEPVVHIFHVATDPAATFFLPGTPGIEIHPLVTPLDGEIVLEKHQPNSFIGTDLANVLANTGADELVVVGMMSSMCVDSTVRAAAEHGFTVTVVHDACAAPDLTFGHTVIPGATVHASFMAALHGSFATVVPSAALVS
ncbi:cysteine hydrolase family protein [Cryobacterium sp. CG_9.6]|uniref:cysteine hydrolase family protein n=1 Tax=Cryobacterium sp. CG_9.6 TaxID=2760710 RepID=UPI002475B460|nr:cysteine hydrolase family protein [Cryobacterium sp. CG_9.6]MDH6237804.1 nicotinamidase-related amidase [Cryobacterium sp. CG_9.6]